METNFTTNGPAFAKRTARQVHSWFVLSFFSLVCRWSGLLSGLFCVHSRFVE
jgi:hypothetical protein